MLRERTKSNYKETKKKLGKLGSRHSFTTVKLTVVSFEVLPAYRIKALSTTQNAYYQLFSSKNFRNFYIMCCIKFLFMNTNYRMYDYRP